MNSFSVVGQNAPRLDAPAKVTGAAQYVGDFRRPGMLYAKILRSPHPHANIAAIDASRAREAPGVAAVLTWQEVPAIPFTSCGHPWPPDSPEDTLILSRRLRYAGDPVAAVAAETREEAEAALTLIDVTYEPLPFYTTPEAALAEGALELHAGSRNIAGENHFEIGDVEAAFARSAFIVEDEYETPIVTHAPIEPHVSLSELDEQGRLTLHVANQVPSIMRERVSRALGLSPKDLRVIRAYVGGGFGGKQEPVYEPLNAALCLATGRPVLLELTREECTACTRTRHASRIRLKSGLSADGEFLAREASVVNNTGAYASHGHNVVFNMASQFCLLYPCENLRFTGKSVYTNILIAGAMRGYGIPQYAFAMESHIDHIAQVLKRDPLEFRRERARKPGDPVPIPDFTLRTSGLDECMRVCEEKIGWKQNRASGAGGKHEGEIRRGVGMALASYGQSCYPHSVELSSARMMVNEDGSAILFTNSADVGQGSDTVMRQVAAEALGVPLDYIRVISGDTDTCPYDTGAFASRQTFVSAHAVKKAALGCKRQILSFAAEKYHYALERLDITGANIIERESGSLVAPLGEVCAAMIYSIHAPRTISFEGQHFPTGNALTFGCTMAQVAVDTVSGKVRVERLVSAMDCGRLINPLAALGQLNGGNIMSLGFGLSEEILVDQKSGRVFNDNLLDYKIPSFADLPEEIEGFFVETDEPSSAYGNKSLGEPPNITAAAAVRNAVLDATGAAINRLPLTPQRVFEALRRQGEAGEGTRCTR